jgi:putative hydroxymethylpyrimidine transport system substrate-binding protein
MRTILLALLLLFPSPAFAADKLTVLLDWYVNPDHAPIIIAQENGFFAEQGLEVTIVPPANPADPPKLVAAGQAEIGVSYQPQLHLMVDEGLPLVRVGTLVTAPLNCLLVRDDGSATTLADLKGKKIGYSLAGFEQALLSAMLASADLALTDVELINVNWSISPSLMSKQVDAVIGAFRNFELTQMELAGIKGRCFYPEEAGVPAYDELVYVAKRDSLDKPLIRRFLAATEKAANYIVNHQDESWRIFSGTAPELQDELNRRAWVDTLPRLSLQPAALDSGRYARFRDFLVKAGLVKNVHPVSHIAIDLGAE